MSKLWSTLIAVVLSTQLCSAQFPEIESEVLTPPLGQFNGRAVALFGDVAFLGAPSGLSVGTSRFVHAYRRVAGHWTLEQTLLPPDGDTRFGFALDFDGTTLVVGSPPLPSGGPGRATVYTHDGASWVGTELTYPPTDEAQISFATSVAVDGDSLLVGAPLTDVPVIGASGENVGAVFAYRRTPAQAWVIKQQIVPSNTSPGLAFGLDVELSGNQALIGTGKERAHAFEFNLGTLWSETQVLTPSLATANSSFGQTIAMSERRAVLGAWQDTTDPDKGSAFVFELVCDDWVERQRLPAPPDALIFGRSVGMSGDVVVVTAQSELVAGANMAGAAYAYRWDGLHWNLEERLHADSPQTNDQFGCDVMVDGDRALIGALSASSSPSGRAFVFDASPLPRPWTDLGFALQGAALSELRGTGLLEPGSPIELQLDCGTPAATGILFAGLAEINASFKGGVLVPEPLFTPVLSLDASGARVFPLNWPLNIPAGTTVALQAWFVDPSGPFGVSASNALRATAMR